jgi:hypothetical protein
MSAKLPNKKRARRSRNKPTISWCDPDTMSPVLRSANRARGQAPRLVALLWRRKADGSLVPTALSTADAAVTGARQDRGC